LNGGRGPPLKDKPKFSPKLGLFFKEGPRPTGSWFGNDPTKNHLVFIPDVLGRLTVWWHDRPKPKGLGHDLALHPTNFLCLSRRWGGGEPGELATLVIKAKSSGEASDPRATGGLIFKLPHLRVDKTKQYTEEGEDPATPSCQGGRIGFFVTTWVLTTRLVQ